MPIDQLVNKFKSQTFVRTANYVYVHAGTCGLPRFLLTPINDNWWVLTTFVWLSIGHQLADANRCQLTNKASVDRLIFQSSVSSIVQALIFKVFLRSRINLLNLMYQSIPRPPIPPGPRAIPGHLTRVELRTLGNLTQNEAPPWDIWLSCQNVCQRSETKGFRNSLIQHVSRIHRSLPLLIPRGFFCCCRFI